MIARPLVDDQARDQEPGENEEHVHTQPAAGKPGAARVEHDDGEHGDTAQPVERGVPEPHADDFYSMNDG